METLEQQIKELLSDIQYWESTYDKLMNKRNIGEEDRLKLSKYYSIYREDLIDKLVSGNYQWSIPRKVMLRKPGSTKYRVVYIYNIKDRLILGALYNVLSDFYKDEISDYCYSYKKGFNTGQAIKFIREYKVNDKQYGVKVDIHAYFNNINDKRKHQMIDELFPNSCGIKQSLESLMYDNRCIYRDEIIQEYKGVIPGTPISSFFANYCLKDCDKYFEEKGSIYARYSDDIIVIEDTMEQVEDDLNIIKQYLTDYGLEINPDKYTYFKPGDDITFLGLRLRQDGEVDMSEHSKEKVKRNIHRWCKKGRKEIEMNNTPFMTVAKRINKRNNGKNFKCYIKNENTFGWCHYMYRYITVDDSLKELDEYTKNTIRAMKTGKHNKANYKAVSEEEFKEMGWVSLVQLYHLYKKDFEYYCEVIDLF